MTILGSSSTKGILTLLLDPLNHQELLQ